MSNPNIVAEGIWLYDGEIEHPFVVLLLDYDPQYEDLKWEGLLEERDIPMLNAKQECYSLARPREGGKFALCGAAKLSIAEIKEYADEFFSSGVTWKP